ncbi:MAG: divalent-cation tolerance protein CutA [Nanopusillaceae archaeon]|jgi:periplasmic divalent cation tolerance protein
MIIVLTTVPFGKGEEIAKKILEKRYAACISIKEVRSLYWENNNIKDEKEELLIIKTRKEIFDMLKDFLKSIHPYKIPEIIEIKVDDGNKEYLDWLESETSLKKIRNA